MRLATCDHIQFPALASRGNQYKRAPLDLSVQLVVHPASRVNQYKRAPLSPADQYIGSIATKSCRFHSGILEIQVKLGFVKLDKFARTTHFSRHGVDKYK